MLRRLDELHNSVLSARDGEIGRCKDFLFDDRWWVVRYMVADTGKWLPGREVLISPLVLGRPRSDNQRLPVELTREQVKDSPGQETDQPVSRRWEMRLFDHFGWPYYWIGGNLWGPYPEPGALIHANASELGEAEDPEQNHLRSAREVTGYSIQAVDGRIGHVEDFFADDASWALRYLLVDTRNWLPGKKVLVSPRWARSIDWAGRSLSMDLTTEQVRNGPEYDPSRSVGADDEKRLFSYYGFPPYWE